MVDFLQPATEIGTAAAIMFPHHDACVTVTAHYEGPTTDILDAIWTELVPYL